MGKKVTMQPGDWIAKEHIRDAEHMERIREAVAALGWEVDDFLGLWRCRNNSKFHQALCLDGEGTLLWKTPECGRRIDPDELIGYDQTEGPGEEGGPWAEGWLERSELNHNHALWFVVPEYGKAGAKVVNYHGEQVASFEEKTEAIEAVEAYNRTILEGNR